MAANKALVKPSLLVWARQRAKVKPEDAAKAANVPVERLETWERTDNDEAPTVSQLRLLAAKYHFPLAVFYLPEPPADFAPLRDFRRLPDAEDEAITPNLAYHIRGAYERRELALELYDELRSQPVAFSLKATIKDDPEKVGQAFRDLLNVDDDSQKRAARQDRAFNFWRRRMEEHDILVFVISGPHYSVGLKLMRGFAIANSELPVIVVNGRDYSQGGKAFALLHELAHIILGESALLISVMTFAFARISAVVAMRVEDYYPKGNTWRGYPAMFFCPRYSLREAMPLVFWDPTPFSILSKWQSLRRSGGF
jgi:hypothetical protein